MQELARHCRRETRGAAETEALLDEVLTAFMEDLGRETLGVQLFGEARLKHTWAQQRAHVACIQDPPGFSLYRQVGSKSKGGVRLPVYRCARGSTLLESFHLHLNRFIAGEQLMFMLNSRGLKKSILLHILYPCSLNDRAMACSSMYFVLHTR